MLTPERRATLIAACEGKSGPTGDMSESVAYERGNDYLTVMTTRPATVADLLRDPSIPTLDVVQHHTGEYRVTIAADHYRAGDVVRCLSRRQMTEEQREAAAERLRSIRRFGPQDAPGAPEPTPDMAHPAPAVPGAPGAAE